MGTGWKEIGSGREISHSVPKIVSPKNLRLCKSQSATKRISMLFGRYLNELFVILFIFHLIFGKPRIKYLKDNFYRRTVLAKSSLNETVAMFFSLFIFIYNYH